MLSFASSVRSFSIVQAGSVIRLLCCIVTFSAFSSGFCQGITVSPASPPNINRAPGQFLVLSGSPRTGGANYTYVWKKDGALLSPNFSNLDPVYLRGPLSYADSGLYSMIVQQGGSPVATNQTRLRVSAKAPQGPGEDDFSRTSGRWSGIYGFNTHDSYLSPTNGRLNYVVEARGAENTQTFYVWDSKARSDEDWEVMIEATIGAGVPVGANGQYFALRLSATVATNPVVPLDGCQGLETTFAISPESGRHIQNVECILADPGYRSWPDQVLSAGTTNVVLRISYDKNSKTLTSYYDTDGAANGYQWRPGERLSMAGAVGLTNHFDLVISGIAENAHPAVTSGQAFFDNFRYALADRREFSAVETTLSLSLGNGSGVAFSSYDGINTWPQGFVQNDWSNFSGELCPAQEGSSLFRTDYVTWDENFWDSFGDLEVQIPLNDSNGDALPDLYEIGLSTSLASLPAVVANSKYSVSNARLTFSRGINNYIGSWTLDFVVDGQNQTESGNYELVGCSNKISFDSKNRLFIDPPSVSYDGSETNWCSGAYRIDSLGRMVVEDFSAISIIDDSPTTNSQHITTNQIKATGFVLSRLGSSAILVGKGKTLNRPWTPTYNSFSNHHIKLTGLDFSLFTPQITSPDFARAQVGQAFSFPIVALNSPSSFAANALPSGLSLNSSSGVISGTPATPGVYPVVLSAANVHGTGPAQTNYFTVMGVNRSLPLDDSFATNSLSSYLNFSVQPAASLAYGSGRLNYVATSAGTNFESIAGIVPNLTLPLSRSWRVEADVCVTNALNTPYTGAGLSLLREVDGGGMFQLYPDRINLKLARDGTNYFGMHSFSDEVDFNEVTTDVATVSEARVRFIYNSASRSLKGSYRPKGSSSWTDLGTESMDPAVFGSLGQAWELAESSVLRVALWADSQTPIVSGNVWVDNLTLTEEVVVETMPAISQQPLSQTAPALSPVTLSVTASGGGLAYQWQRNNTNLPGAISSSYGFSPTVAMGGNYRVIVSNSIGSITSAVASLTVNKATPVTAWDSLPPISYGTALSAAQLGATASVGGSWSYSRSSGLVLDAGSYLLTASFVPTDTVNYEAVTRTNNLTVTKASQVLSGFALSSGTAGTKLFLGASAPGGSVTYVSSDPSVAQVSGNQLLLLKSGYVTITASHPGNSNYFSVSVPRNLTVKAPAMRFEFDPNNLLLGGVGTTAGDKDDPGAKLVIANPNSYYQATVVTNGGVVTTNYTAINTVATYSNLILGQPRGLSAYTNWVAGLGAGEGLARFNIFLRGDMANAAAWGQTLKLGPTNSPELLASGDAANGWNYQITQFGTIAPGNTDWGYSIEWFTTNDALRIRPGGVDLGLFSFTAPLESYLNGQVSQILFGSDGWSTTNYTVWFGTQNQAGSGGVTPLYALEFDNVWGTSSGGGVTPFANTSNSLWNGTLVLQGQDVNLRKIWNVTTNGAGRRDGMGWANAFDNVQAAIDRATSGDEIWIQEGVYRPTRLLEPATTSDARTKTFILKGGVSLLGGFGGTETNVASRNPALRRTVLSGDLSGNDTTVWPPDASRSENAYHVLTALAQSERIVLDGLSITGGNANNTNFVQPNNGSVIPAGENPHEVGGAGILLESSLEMRQCETSFNHAINLGGLLLVNLQSTTTARLDLISSTFSKNLSSSGDGGAVVAHGATNPSSIGNVQLRAVGCLFEANECRTGPDRDLPANGFPDGGNGAAIHLKRAKGVIANSVFTQNFANGNGFSSGGSPTGEGGAIYAHDRSQVQVVSSLFSANQADANGAGIATQVGTQLELYYCTFQGNVVNHTNWGAAAVSGWYDPARGDAANTLAGYGNVFWQNVGGVGEVELAVQGATRSSYQLSHGTRSSDGSLLGNTGTNVLSGAPGFHTNLPVGADGKWRTRDDGCRITNNVAGTGYQRVPGLRPVDFADMDEDGNLTESAPFDILGYNFVGTNFQAGAYQELLTGSPGQSPGAWDFATGNYSLGAGEGLLLELGGTEASLYDRIFARSGSVTLDGIVNLMFWGTYTGPVAGSWDTFDLIWARDGIVLGDHLQVQFLQSGYQLETKVVDKNGGKLWQAKIRAAVVASPGQATANAKPNLSLVRSPGIGGNTELFYTYRRPSGGGYSGGVYSAGGVRYVVEFSSDMRTWNPVSTQEISTTPGEDGWESATVLILGSSQKGFVRIRASSAN